MNSETGSERTRILIQERDLEIMKYGLEQKFITVEQVTNKFFAPTEGVKERCRATYLRVLRL